MKAKKNLTFQELVRFGNVKPLQGGSRQQQAPKENQGQKHFPESIFLQKPEEFKKSITSSERAIPIRMDCVQHQRVLTDA